MQNRQSRSCLHNPRVVELKSTLKLLDVRILRCSSLSNFISPKSSSNMLPPLIVSILSPISLKLASKACNVGPLTVTGAEVDSIGLFIHCRYIYSLEQEKQKGFG